MENEDIEVSILPKYDDHNGDYWTIDDKNFDEVKSLFESASKALFLFSQNVKKQKAFIVVINKKLDFIRKYFDLIDFDSILSSNLVYNLDELSDKQIILKCVLEYLSSYVDIKKEMCEFTDSKINQYEEGLNKFKMLISDLYKYSISKYVARTNKLYIENGFPTSKENWKFVNQHVKDFETLCQDLRNKGYRVKGL